VDHRAKPGDDELYETYAQFVIAGLDPAIHVGKPLGRNGEMGTFIFSRVMLGRNGDIHLFGEMGTFIFSRVMLARGMAPCFRKI